MKRVTAKHWLATFFGAALLASAGAASAHHKPGHVTGNPHGVGNPNAGGNPHGLGPRGSDVGDQIEISPAGITARFDDTVIRIVNDWYQANPQIRAGYTALPPGIAMNLARGKPLPPGIAKRVLPTGLQTLLPAAPQGYGRFIVGDDLVLLELSSGLIADVVNLFAGQ